MNLAYLLDNKQEVQLVDENSLKGSLQVSVVPLNENYREVDENDPIFNSFIDDPNYFLGKNLYFRLDI